MSTPPTPPEPAPEAMPIDVAAWLRARTQDSEGREIGLWNEDTRPSVGQVEVALKQARAIIAGKVGWQKPDACSALYELLVALEAACIIEKSYFPEQVASDRSAYDQLREEATDYYAALTTCIADAGQGAESSGAYSVCTPVEHCGCDSLWAPDNWNDPYAGNIDDPYESDDAAVRWLRSMQPVWAGTSLEKLTARDIVRRLAAELQTD